MIKENIQRSIQDIINKQFHTQIDVEIFYPKEESFGDYTTNIAFPLAKILKKSPDRVANEIVSHLKSSYIEKIEIIKGYINMFLSREGIELILESSIQKDYGRHPLGNGEKILIEFVSANPTGPLTVPNARAAAIGDALINLFNFENYQADAEFYVNDGGRQVELLGLSILERMKEMEGKKFSIPDGGYAGKYVKDIAREILSESGKTLLKNKKTSTVPIYLREIAVKKILNMQENTLKNYGVIFDNWYRESDLRKSHKPEEIIALLEEKKLVEKKEGALWFLSERLGEKRNRVLVKSNGDFTYLLPDIAYHKDKFDRGYHLLIDLLGPDHIEQVPSIKNALNVIGYPGDKIEVVIVQWVNLIKQGKKMKMSKRSGEFITMDDLIDEVGKDACRFIFLLTKPSTPVNFDIDLAKESSSKNPVYYVQYSYARISNIFKYLKKKIGKDFDFLSADFSLIKEKEAIDLVKSLRKFPEVIETSVKERDPTHIPPYLITLASKFHSFYQKYKVVDTEDIPMTKARLYLAKCTQNVIGKGLELIGVERKENM